MDVNGNKIVNELKKNMFLVEHLKLNTIKDESALYTFYDKHKKPLYVGQTLHLRARLSKQLNSRVNLNLLESQQCYFFRDKIVYISYFSIDSKNTCVLFALESWLINCLNPLFNKTYDKQKNKLIKIIKSLVLKNTYDL
jgi:excinuclease UvrABC nuclease subunit